MLRNAIYVDGTGAPAQGPVDIVIENDRIVQIASIGAPGSFNTAVVAALGALSRLSTGTLVVSDREVKLSGDALYEGAANDIRAGLGKDFPKNWQYKPEITVKPASESSRAMRSVSA